MFVSLTFIAYLSVYMSQDFMYKFEAVMTDNCMTVELYLQDINIYVFRKDNVGYDVNYNGEWSKWFPCSNEK